MKTDPNEPASPVEVSNFDGNIIGNQTSQFSYFATGLTKREHFAGLIMQGLVSKYGNDYQPNHPTEAVYMADALIAELNRTQD